MGTPPSAPATGGPLPALNIDCTTTNTNTECSSSNPHHQAHHSSGNYHHLAVPTLQASPLTGPFATRGSARSGSLRDDLLSSYDDGDGDLAHRAKGSGTNIEYSTLSQHHQHHHENTQYSLLSGSDNGDGAGSGGGGQKPIQCGAAALLSSVDGGANKPSSPAALVVAATEILNKQQQQQQQQTTNSANNTPNSASVHLRISRPASRSPSPSVSPATSMFSCRKVSLAHVSVSAFAICRSGAILSFYRSHTNPDESELGFSPLNAMNQCAPVNLHGLEKFVLLLADRCHRREGRVKEERDRRAARKRKKLSFDKGRKEEKSTSYLHSPKQVSAADTTTSPDTDLNEAGNSVSQRDTDTTLTAAAATAATPSVCDSKQLSEARRHHKHHHKRHHHRHTRSTTLDRLSDDGDSRGGRGGGGGSVWRIFEDAIGWRLERSIDANYVLLREHGTCRCFAFRMRGSRSKHGQDNAGGGKCLNKLDLAAVACFEPELPPLRHFTSSKTDGKAVTIHKPAKQQYLLSESEVLTLSLTGDLFLTEASTIEKVRSEDSMGALFTPGSGAGLLSGGPSTVSLEGGACSAFSSPGISAQHQILQQMQHFTLRMGSTRKLPLPGACSRFTAWMLENDDNNTLLLVAIPVADPETIADVGASPDPRHHSIPCKDDPPNSTGMTGFPFRRVLVYCVEETRVLYEFQLGHPSSLCPQYINLRSLKSPCSLSPNAFAASPEVSPSNPNATPSPSAQRPQSQSPLPAPLLPLLYESTSASIHGLTVVSAHEESAMAIAWTPYQADVLTCCPNWSHFSLFFITPTFTAAISAHATAQGNSSNSVSADDQNSEKVDPVEDLLSPLGMMRSKDSCLLAAAAAIDAKDKPKSFNASTSDSDSGLLTVLCVCPGDRAPHALVGAATKDDEDRKRGQKAAARTEQQLTAHYAEEYLAFFLLSNGAIYALTAPNSRSGSKTGSGSGGKGAATGSRGDASSREEPHNVCPAQWVGGDLYIHVDESSSSAVCSPNTAGTTRDFARMKMGGRARKSRNGSSSPFSVPNSPTAALPSQADGAPGAMERALRVVRVATVFNACFHTPSAVENCAMRYCPVDRDFLDVRGMLYLYGTHASTKELVKDAIVVE